MLINIQLYNKIFPISTSKKVKSLIPLSLWNYVIATVGLKNYDLYKNTSQKNTFTVTKKVYV